MLYGDACFASGSLVAYAQRHITAERCIGKRVHQPLQRYALGCFTVAENAYDGSCGRIGQMQRAVGKCPCVIITGNHANACAHAAVAAHALPVGQQVIHPAAAAAVQHKMAIAAFPAIGQRDACIGIILLYRKALEQQIIGQCVIAQRVQIPHEQIRRNANADQRAVSAVGGNHQITLRGMKISCAEFACAHNKASRHLKAS